MEIPSVTSLFESKMSSVMSRVPANMQFGGSFSSELTDAITDGQDDATDASQTLTIEPDTGDGQAQQSALALSADTANLAATSSSYSMGLTKSGLPMFIPAASVNAAYGLGSSSASAAVGQQVAAFAQQYVGTPYVAGGEDLDRGVDCSGFVQSVYKQFGINLPRSANNQSKVGTEVDPNNLKPGDLVFFKTADYAPVTHVAMYIGNGKLVEARGVKWGVTITKMTSGWEAKRHFIIARRVLPQ